MLRASVRAALFVAGAALAVSGLACGKKAPLRLTDERTAERAPTPRARVREDRVTLDFRVPAHRFFPEREQPWVLARILRQTGPSSELVEAGALLMAKGFAFDSPLSWSDVSLPAKTSYVYRVEFRDAVRRRRALSEPLAVSWDELPDAPSHLIAAGRLRSIVLNWTAPAGEGVGFRIYRRERPGEFSEQAAAGTVSGSTFVDSRIETGREYCYVVRAVFSARSLEIEGPASPESCSSAEAEELPRITP